MFGVSLTEFVLILVVALVVLGPQRLPGMLRTVGLWINKIRRMTTEVRAQTGIDDLLRSEGIHGGLGEVRALLRGDPRPFLEPLSTNYRHQPFMDPYVNGTADDGTTVDRDRERPVEGPDAYGAIPEDLLEEFRTDKAELTDHEASEDDPSKAAESVAMAAPLTGFGPSGTDETPASIKSV